MTHAIAPAAARIDSIGGETMGTTWSVRLVVPARDGADPGRTLHALHACVQRCLDAIVAQMSHWQPASDLCRYNRAPRGWVEVPGALAEVLACALEIARASDGAFDPTLGELADLWGFGPAGPRAAPPRIAQLEAARARAGWEKLSLDREGRRAFQPGGLRLDLSAIAKGHAVDRVLQALQARGVADALVEVGGELRACGHKPDGTRWRVLVETAHEVDGDAAPEVLALDGMAVATSGDRWHRFRHDGVDYAHTLDPRTGAPLRDAPLAATVVAGDAMRADAWATACSVMGRERALALAAQRGIALRLVGRVGGGIAISRSPAFERLAAA